tara:strand:+ start:241 stop:507 length:267 start_codon:yes stop_codon:yes gene_type:complete
MKFADIKFSKTDNDFPKSIQAILPFGDYDLSIVQSDFSYGGKQGLYEIAVFKGKNMIEMPGITEEGDTVKGFLSENDVESIIEKMEAI